MAKTYTISTIEHAVELAMQLRRYWFRGHSRVVGSLTPAVHRLFEKNVEPFTEANVLKFESYSYMEFQRVAPTLQDALPPFEEPSLWLFLMQHHGAATRLLDWTESALFALYFCVSADPEDDGEVWALRFQSLNRLAGIQGYPTYSDPRFRYLVMEPILQNRDSYMEKIGLAERPRKPIGVRPILRIPRMIAQQCTFTLHPFPHEGHTIRNLLADPIDLVRYVVRADRKEQLRRDLWTLGVHRRVLFPDLDGLARSLREEQRTWPREPTELPTLAGEWLRKEERGGRSA